jgi:hypothetical protein
LFPEKAIERFLTVERVWEQISRFCLTVEKILDFLTRAEISLDKHHKELSKTKAA